jgi:hypothetical protein
MKPDFHAALQQFQSLSRPQQIGAGIVAALALLVLNSAYAWWAGQHAQVDKDLAAETTKNQGLVKVKLQADNAKLRVAKLRERSLPSDQENARRLYQGWLLAQFEEAGFRDIKVNPGPASQHENLYLVLDFRVSGRANLKQMTDFLYRFYSVDLLHRLQRISVSPQPDSKEIDIEVSAEAIMFLDAPKVDQLRLQKSDRLTGNLADYWKTILNRNLPGPANHPPTLAKIDAQKVRRGETLSVSPKATDPDNLDHLTFSLEKAPEGAKIDAKSGKVSWKPPGNGSYELTIRVEDDGWPAKVASQKFAVTVSDPPPPTVAGPRDPGPPPGPAKPKWELGRFTFITAVTESDGQPEAWFSVRTTGELMRLRPGDKFDVMGLKGTIAGIDDETIELEVQGKRYTVRLGENLGQAVEARGSAS